MSRYAGNNDTCPVCGLRYKKLRTELKFVDVKHMLWGHYARRNSVLGKWHQIKKELWKKHLEDCSENAGDAWEGFEAIADGDERLDFEF